MTVVIKPKSTLKGYCSFRHITPTQVLEKGHQAGELVCTVNNRVVRLDDFFEVLPRPESRETAGDLPQRPFQLVLQGDFSKVDHIGAGLQSGSILVKGSVGAHCGAEMNGGHIQVEQDCGNFLGAQMTGGRIQVEGNAGDFVGSAYPGQKCGMNRGQILIAGRAGDGVGFRMRRGTVLCGSVGRLAGWQMRAGTLVVGSQSGPLGHFMVRGTIISLAGRPISPTVFHIR